MASLRDLLDRLDREFFWVGLVGLHGTSYWCLSLKLEGVYWTRPFRYACSADVTYFKPGTLMRIGPNFS
jgi:hypothetical protein